MCGTMSYCVTISYSADYDSYVCSEDEGVEYQLEPYWSGISNLIAFPIYTGSNGVSTGTQYPPGYPTPTSTTQTHETSTSSDSNSASASSFDQTVATSLTSRPNSSQKSKPAAPIGAIVGGVVGGLVVASLCVAAIIFLLIRNRKHRQEQERQIGPGLQYFPPQLPKPGSDGQYSSMGNPPAQPPAYPNLNSHDGVGHPVSTQNELNGQSTRFEYETQNYKPELGVSRGEPQYELQGSSVMAIKPLS
ncbi:hypothetical protein N7478_006338 [Penicillium angulare]|uniref:uncharacterized protein n=1 Tax=Penicillium angulare TaxID=116970 RepID=UPI002540429F|nr:uncharacterized protein N7478_006338 [Penicillium angulare]KAJ5280966.1 hypothetical protein N7478_006338 [Penicillium angulare]